MSSRTVEYRLVDVFARHRYEGNQLAVVLDAHDLTPVQMQRIACELNLSETTFPRPCTPAETAAGADYGVRIFTASAELPFAGHPTLGTAWVLAQLGRLQSGGRRQACGAGLIGVSVPAEPAGLVELAAAPRDLSPALPPAAAEACLASVGLGAADLAGDVVVAGCGLSFVHLPVRLDALARARVRVEPMAAVDVGGYRCRDPLIALNVYSVERPVEVPVDGAGEGADHRALSIRSRVFVPGPSVPEDPATGSAAVGLGVALVATGDAVPDGLTTYGIVQGVEMGRPSQLHGRVLAGAGAAETCWVAGRVIAVGEGRLRVPDA
jgi:trans-2,3-dihydro-3-hydroxyanthranilate isomerase